MANTQMGLACTKPSVGDCFVIGTKYKVITNRWLGTCKLISFTNSESQRIYYYNNFLSGFLYCVKTRLFKSLLAKQIPLRIKHFISYLVFLTLILLESEP